MNKKELVNKPNQTIMITNKNITTVQRKAYNVILHNVQKILRDNPQQYLFKISISDLKKQAGIEATNNVQLKESLKNLTQTSVEIIHENGDWSIFNLLSQAEKLDNFIEIALPPKIIQQLIKNDYYTTLDLMIIKTLNSKYAVILYEFAIRYKKVQIPELTIKEFKELAGILETKTYKNFNDVKRNVIEPAIKEINEKTDINLNYDLKFMGRKTAHIKFKIIKKEPNNQIELKNSETEEINFKNNDLEKLLNLLPNTESLDIWKQKLSEALKKHSFEMLKEDLIYTVKHKPVNLLNYFEKSIKNGHYSVYESTKKKAKEQSKQKKLEKELKIKEEKEKSEKELNKKVLDKYNNLNAIELELFETKYNLLPENVKNSVSKEFLIKAMIKEFFEKNKI